MLVFIFFSYGVVADKLDLWPSNTYKRAIEAYKADSQREEEIKAVMDNAELLAKRKISSIAAAAKVALVNPQKTQNGFTLVAVGKDAAMLIDMQGKVLHTWKLPYSKVWGKQPPHVNMPNPDEMTRFIDVQLFPNGDLLVIYHADNDTPYGYGMVKMDKDAKILWSFAKNVHHDMYVAQDSRIFTLTHSYIDGYAKEIPHFKSPVLADAVTILSSEGKELDSIPLVEAFLNSPYEQLLYAPVSDNDDSKHDYTHANSVMMLEEDIAQKFPMFKSGQLLVSLRNLNAIVVIDPQSRKVVWGMRGIWKQQHDAQFTPNGHIMLFDNQGYDTGTENPRSRILEFDPATSAVAWSFTGTPSDTFYSSFHGSQQTLPNGNILTVESGEGNRILEITHDKEVVWSYTINPKNFRQNPLNKATRIVPEFLTAEFRESLMKPPAVDNKH